MPQEVEPLSEDELAAYYKDGVQTFTLAQAVNLDEFRRLLATVEELKECWKTAEQSARRFCGELDELKQECSDVRLQSRADKIVYDGQMNRLQQERDRLKEELENARRGYHIDLLAKLARARDALEKIELTAGAGNVYVTLDKAVKGLAVDALKELEADDESTTTTTP